jgi:membrane protease YdiL (CAAX protease family)
MVGKIAVVSPRRDNWVKTHSVVSYFVLTFAISWGGVLAVIAPKLLGGESIPRFTGLMLFPVLLLGPLIAGLGMTAYISGRKGLRDLFGRVGKVRIGARWYMILLIPPVLILVVLALLRTFVSSSFAPNRFLPGLGFGVFAGFVEELGWTGFAFPTMTRKITALWASITLSVLWAVWHIPVVDYLGAATPHGQYWLSYFIGFAAAMSAIRVLICWAYANTGSLLLAQLMHMVSTGCLVALGPAAVTAGEEALWYGSYGIALWLVVAIVVSIYGKGLTGASAHQG